MGIDHLFFGDWFNPHEKEITVLGNSLQIKLRSPTCAAYMNTNSESPLERCWTLELAAWRLCVVVSKESLQTFPLAVQGFQLTFAFLLAKERSTSI